MLVRRCGDLANEGGGGAGESQGSILGARGAGEEQKARLRASHRWGQRRAASNISRGACSLAFSTFQPEPLSSSNGPSEVCVPEATPTLLPRCIQTLESACLLLAFYAECASPVLCSPFAPLSRGPGKAEAPGVFLFSWKLRELMWAMYFSVFHKTHNCVI